MTESQPTMVRAYLIALHLLLALLVWKSDVLPKAKALLFESAPTSNPHVAHTFAYHRSMDPSVPEGAAIFLGDSITQSLATAAVAPRSVNYGIGFATTGNLLAHLPEYQSLQRASVVYLMIGVNDLLLGQATGLHDRLRQIAQALPAGRQVVWSGLMPVFSPEVRPALVTEANAVIRAACAARPPCTYVDTVALFGEDPSLFRDGIHPNTLGYARWIGALRQAAAR